MVQINAKTGYKNAAKNRAEAYQSAARVSLSHASGAGLSYRHIVSAAERIAGQIAKTPMVPAVRLAQLTGVDLWIKLENLQATGAFKERGALNKLLNLSAEERERGVVAASAGNHAQGLAYHGTRLSIPVIIVMPETTPDVKVQRSKEFGATVVLTGSDFEEARHAAQALSREKNMVFVHPFDDPDIIAGQGTIALEMLEDGPFLDTIIAPVGGGGLLSGLCVGAKALRPDIEVIGVEALLFPSMKSAIDKVEREVGGSTLAEGIAVRQAGTVTRQIIGAFVNDILLVDEPTLERALSLLINEQKLVAEGAGAAGLAAILANPEKFKGKKVGIVLGGGNIDQRLLSMVLTRDLARSGRLARLRIKLLDVPGQLVSVATIIAREGGNVTDVGHHRTYSDLPAKMTCMDVTIDTQGHEHLGRIIQNLRGEGYQVEIVTH